jgi:hypothetical protein
MDHKKNFVSQIKRINQKNIKIKNPYDTLFEQGKGKDNEKERKIL